MAETTPSQSETAPQPDDIELAELSDPIAGVVAAELASCFVRLCMCKTEPVVSRLVRFEPALRKPGGIELEKSRVARWLYGEIDRSVFRLMAAAVPLAHAEFALSRVEVLLREHFSDIAGTAASYLLSDGRDAAIQMATVATTMAAREVRSGVAEIIGQTRDEDPAPDEEV